MAIVRRIIQIMIFFYFEVWKSEENVRVLIDTLRSFNKKGELKTMQVFRGIITKRSFFIENLKGSYAKKRDGFYTQIDDSTYIKSKAWKYYYKNGKIKFEQK